MDCSVLHDATLRVIELRWFEGIICIRVIYWDGICRHGAIVGAGVSEVNMPRAFPWGDSQSINHVSLGEHEGKNVLRVEMQSGDEFVIQAAAFSFEAGDAVSREDDAAWTVDGGGAAMPADGGWRGPK